MATDSPGNAQRTEPLARLIDGTLTSYGDSATTSTSCRSRASAAMPRSWPAAGPTPAGRRPDSRSPSEVSFTTSGAGPTRPWRSRTSRRAEGSTRRPGQLLSGATTGAGGQGRRRGARVRPTPRSLRSTARYCARSASGGLGCAAPRASGCSPRADAPVVDRPHRWPLASMAPRRLRARGVRVGRRQACRGVAYQTGGDGNYAGRSTSISPRAVIGSPSSAAAAASGPATTGRADSSRSCSSPVRLRRLPRSAHARVGVAVAVWAAGGLDRSRQPARRPSPAARTSTAAG